jgi:hypothetical protein
VLLQAAANGGPFVFTARVAVSRTMHGIVGVVPAPAPRVIKAERLKDA